MPKIAKAVGRSVEEWIGATPDARPPKRVLVRIFDRADGRCHITGRKIAPGEKWQAEHIKRLADGGENRESNLAPALVEPHKVKSAAERSAAVPVNRRHETNIGLKAAPRRPIRSRGFAERAPREKRLTKSTPGAPAIFRQIEDV